MKKFLLIFLSFLIVLGVAGCSRSPANKDREKPPASDTPPPDESAFTVQLYDVEGEENFGVYKDEFDTTALFTSKEDGSVTEVPFDTHGFARAEGLDGDYTVTLNDLDDRYAYNPNIYTATNDDRNITVKVFKILKYTGEGTGWYKGNVLELPKAGGIYRIPVNSLSHQVHCQFHPSSGEYYIESLCDITANEINPRMEIHEANSGWVYEDRIKENINFTDDAACSSFTKNFRVRLSADSNQYVLAFKLTCDSRVDYPAYVDLYVVRASDYLFGEEPEYGMYIPEEEFTKTPDYPDKQFRFIAHDDPNGVLRGERVKFNAVDGYYHMVDENGVMTDDILYAKISGSVISPNGSAVLNFQDKPLDRPDFGESPQVYWQTYFYLGGKNYIFMIQGYRGLVSAEYEEAEQYEDKKSYIDYVNKDGVYAVTREMKDFLQAYAVAMRLFYDGYGMAENNGYNSNDANQWLFACGYYL